MTKPELMFHLQHTPLKKLQQMADKVRQNWVGNKVYLRAIIEFSNYCCRSCLYCGLRKENKRLKRYRLAPDSIIQLAQNIISKYGIKTIVLQSGDDFAYDTETISFIIQKIKQKADVAITLSLGERDFTEFEAWRRAGADRYLMKHETANPHLYARLHPGKTLNQRLKALKQLQALGYEVGLGCMVGLPGQTLDDLAEDILLIRDFPADMAGIGPFIPQEETPLSQHPAGDLSLTLKVIALTRITSQNVHLPVTTALVTLDQNGGLEALLAGANVIMPDFTPLTYSQQYKIYNNKAKITLEFAQALTKQAGRKLNKEKGGSLKCKTLPKD